MQELGIGLITWLALLVMMISLMGLVVPVFPGGVIIWLTALLYGLLTGFGPSGGWVLAIMTVLMVAGALADNVLMGTKAKEAGASWRSIIMALVAGLVFSFTLTPIGGIVIAALTLYLMERTRLQDNEKALKITKALIVGCGWAFLIRFGLGVLKIGIWIAWVWNRF